VDDGIAGSGDDRELIFHQTERFAHAMYGLIIITAVLVAEVEHVPDPIDALVIVLGTGVVLLLAHTYVAVVAERTLLKHRLESDERVQVFTDNLPVMIAVIGPSVLFVAAEAGAIDIETAFRWAIGFTLVALYAIGVFEGRRIGYSWIRSLVVGLGGALIGAVIIGIESMH
jgi:hypothetical protein